MYESNTSQNAPAIVADNFGYPSSIDQTQYNINGWRRVNINLAVNRTIAQFIPQIVGRQLVILSSDVPVSLIPNAQNSELPVSMGTNSMFRGVFSGLLLQHADYSAATMPLVLSLLVCSGDSEFVPPQYFTEHSMSLPVNQVNSLVLNGTTEARFPIPPGARRIKYSSYMGELTLSAVATGPAYSRISFKRPPNASITSPTLTGYAGVTVPGKIAPASFIPVNVATFIYRVFGEFMDVAIPTGASEAVVSLNVGPADTVTAVSAILGGSVFANCIVE